MVAIQNCSVISWKNTFSNSVIKIFEINEKNFIFGYNLSQFPKIVEATINEIVSASAQTVLSIAIAICGNGLSSSWI